MGLLCGNANTIELKIARRAGIMNHGAAVAKIVGGPCRSIDTHMTHRTADHDLFDAIPIQDVFQVRIPKLLTWFLRITVSPLIGCTSL